MAKATKNGKRLARYARVRKHISGTPERPRLCVFKSSKNIYAQLIDDTNGTTIAAASTLDKDIKAALTAEIRQLQVGWRKRRQESTRKGIDTVAFDRGGFLFHGRVKN